MCNDEWDRTNNQCSGDNTSHAEPLRDNIEPQMECGTIVVPKGHHGRGTHAHENGTERERVQLSRAAHDPTNQKSIMQII